MLTTDGVQKKAAFLRLAQRTLHASLLSKKADEVNVTFTHDVDVMLTNPPYQKKSTGNSGANNKRIAESVLGMLFKKARLVKLCFIANSLQKKPFDIGFPMWAEIGSSTPVRA